MSKKLVGSELLDYCRENEGQPEKVLAEGAGYYTTLPDGGIQVNTKPFYQALSMASGLVAPETLGKSSAVGRRGKSLAYNLKTNLTSGNAVVTSGYLKQIGVMPGERVSVEIIAEAGELVLKRASDEDEEAAAPVAKVAAAVI